MSCAECNSSIGQGIMYEVIRAATLINFNSTLIDRAASNISRFLTSANNDWKYCGGWGRGGANEREWALC